MNYQEIDLKTWPRLEYFNHYLKVVPCTYSLTITLDITNLLEKKYHLYSSLIYAITKTVNQYKEFRLRFIDDKLVLFDSLNPCYTIFHKDDETFSNLWSFYRENFLDFQKEYFKDIENYGETKGFLGKDEEPLNTFPISMIPWLNFQGFNLNLEKGYDYLAPIFTLGKYYKNANNYLIPLAMQVHHACCDGFHVARFLDSLQDVIRKL